MFDDARSKRVILVAHCVLNQNAKLDRCAHYPGAIPEVTRMLIDSGAGLLQLPCPELMCLGLDRAAEPGAVATIEAEDTRIAACMAQPDARSACRDLAEAVLHQVREYRRHGFEIVGLVGINGSPTCGVETTWYDDQEREGPGVFVDLVRTELVLRDISIPMRGIKAYRPAEAVRAVQALMSRV